MNELKKMSAKCNIRINKFKKLSSTIPKSSESSYMLYVTIERYKKDFFKTVQNVIVFLVLLEEPCAVKAACTVLGRVWRL